MNAHIAGETERLLFESHGLSIWIRSRKDNRIFGTISRYQDKWEICVADIPGHPRYDTLQEAQKVVDDMVRKQERKIRNPRSSLLDFTKFCGILGVLLCGTGTLLSPASFAPGMITLFSGREILVGTGIVFLTAAGLLYLHGRKTSGRKLTNSV